MMTFPLYYGLSKTGLPLIVVNIFGNEVCLMLDTGSNRNIIDQRIFDQFRDRLTTSETSSEVLTLNGTTQGMIIDVPFTFENDDYHEPFLCVEMTDTFDKIHDESGIQIYGSLGNHFFLKYGWIIDFERIEVYTNNKKTI